MRKPKGSDKSVRDWRTTAELDSESVVIKSYLGRHLWATKTFPRSEWPAHAYDQLQFLLKLCEVFSEPETIATATRLCESAQNSINQLLVHYV